MNTSLMTEKTHMHKNQATVVSKESKIRINLVLKTLTKERRKMTFAFIRLFRLILKQISPGRFFKILRKLSHEDEWCMKNECSWRK